jgi:DNA-binding response OmpR family regulator
VRLRQPENGSQPRDEVLTVGGVRLDVRAREVSAAGRTSELSAREFKLVEIFMLNAGQVLSREQLLSHVWGYDFDPGSNVVDVYVGYLRKKLGSERISTMRGVGYRFNA